MRVALALVALALAAGCSHAKPPAWLSEHAVRDGRVCAWGIAGRAYDPSSEAPQQLAIDNGVDTLAGAYLSAVVQSEMSRANQSHDLSSRFEVVVEVPEDVRDAVARAIEDPDIWRDPEGVGPLGPEGRGFTYARVCIEDPAIHVEAERRGDFDVAPFASAPPPWIDRVSSVDDASLCAVGSSLPVYNPADIFQNIVESVRAQLIENAKTWVLESLESRTHCRSSGDCTERARQELAVTTEAISKGVVLTHFWYDWKGDVRQRGAWAWGCVYRAVAAEGALARMRARLAGR